MRTNILLLIYRKKRIHLKYSILFGKFMFLNFVRDGMK